MMLLSMGSSDKSGSNENGSSVFDHYFVVSGLIKFKRKIRGRGKSYVQRKLVSDGGMRPAGEHGYTAEDFISELGRRLCCRYCFEAFPRSRQTRSERHLGWYYPTQAQVSSYLLRRTRCQSPWLIPSYTYIFFSPPERLVSNLQRSVQCTSSTTQIFHSNSCKDGRVKIAPTEGKSCRKN